MGTSDHVTFDLGEEKNQNQHWSYNFIASDKALTFCIKQPDVTVLV